MRPCAHLSLGDLVREKESSGTSFRVNMGETAALHTIPSSRESFIEEWGTGSSFWFTSSSGCCARAVDES
jgi:hypothetical protein